MCIYGYNQQKCFSITPLASWKLKSKCRECFCYSAKPKLVRWSPEILVWPVCSYIYSYCGANDQGVWLKRRKASNVLQCEQICGSDLYQGVDKWFSVSVENGRTSRKLDIETDFVFCVCVYVHVLVWTACNQAHQLCSVHSENLKQSFAVLYYGSRLTLDIDSVWVTSLIKYIFPLKWMSW